MTDARPCRYPGCQDPEDPHGNPRMTTENICTSLGRNGTDQGCQQRFRRDIRYLVTDWVQLQALPAPIRRPDNKIRRTTREYGHPAEWASDKAAHIAAILNDTHDALADALGHEPPPHPGTSEKVRVRAAWTYLAAHHNQLCRQYWVCDTAIEIRDQHRQIRSRLGQNRPRIILPTPCPRCEHFTLVRTIDYRRDQIDCGNCNHTITGDHYGFYTRLLLGTFTVETGERQ